jgi:hypothetical protein
MTTPINNLPVSNLPYTQPAQTRFQTAPTIANHNPKHKSQTLSRIPYKISLVPTLFFFILIFVTLSADA